MYSRREGCRLCQQQCTECMTKAQWFVRLKSIAVVASNSSKACLLEGMHCKLQ